MPDNPLFKNSKGWGIQQDQSPTMPFRQKHPWIAKAGDLLSGGATDPNTELGPVDLLSAGLPFASIMKGPVYHGTRQVIEHFNPLKNDELDTLGWMTHFATRPGYADNFAKGIMKFTPGTRENIIPAKLHANNVLDLKNPNPDDMAAMIGNLEPTTKKELLDLYKNRFNSEYYYSGNNRLQKAADFLSRAGVINKDAFERSPFDAIRYSDAGQDTSFATNPYKGLVTTPWGTPLTQSGNPLKVIRK